MSDQDVIAFDEMRERIKTLRDKAERNRKDAEYSESQAAESHAAAVKCDGLADQYEAILRFAKNRMTYTTVTSGGFGIASTYTNPE